MINYDLMAAHNMARFNRATLAKDSICGCFYCLKVFSPSEIEEWCSEMEEDEEVTAICPYCGIDSVIGKNSGFPISQDFLKTMQQRWFGKEDIDA